MKDGYEIERDIRERLIISKNLQCLWFLFSAI